MSLSKPRTRGDDPGTGKDPLGAAGKPRTRGDDPDAYMGADTVTHVNPARAGMIPHPSCRTWSAPRKPRTRGDDPALINRIGTVYA